MMSKIQAGRQAGTLSCCLFSYAVFPPLLCSYVLNICLEREPYSQLIQSDIVPPPVPSISQSSEWV